MCLKHLVLSTELIPQLWYSLCCSGFRVPETLSSCRHLTILFQQHAKNWNTAVAAPEGMEQHFLQQTDCASCISYTDEAQLIAWICFGAPRKQVTEASSAPKRSGTHARTAQCFVQLNSNINQPKQMYLKLWDPFLKCCEAHASKAFVWQRPSQRKHEQLRPVCRTVQKRSLCKHFTSAGLVFSMNNLKMNLLIWSLELKTIAEGNLIQSVINFWWSYRLLPLSRQTHCTRDRTQLGHFWFASDLNVSWWDQVYLI